MIIINYKFQKPKNTVDEVLKYIDDDLENIRILKKSLTKRELFGNYLEIIACRDYPENASCFNGYYCNVCKPIFDKFLIIQLIIIEIKDDLGHRDVQRFKSDVIKHYKKEMNENSI